jgi:hypothetical protein
MEKEIVGLVVQMNKIKILKEEATQDSLSYVSQLNEKTTRFKLLERDKLSE